MAYKFYGIPGLVPDPTGDGKIDSEKEVYNFLSGIPEKSKLTQMILSIRSFGEVYIGVAEESSDVIVDSCFYDVVKIGKPVAIDDASGYLWVIVPAAYTAPTITMSGMEVPVTMDGTTSISGQDYNIWKSKDQYSGSFNIFMF